MLEKCAKHTSNRVQHDVPFRKGFFIIVNTYINEEPYSCESSRLPVMVMLNCVAVDSTGICSM
jgi:hypothetical protein